MTIDFSNDAAQLHESRQPSKYLLASRTQFARYRNGMISEIAFVPYFSQEDSFIDCDNIPGFSACHSLCSFETDLWKFEIIT